jgi:hypothetical protein
VRHPGDLGVDRRCPFPIACNGYYGGLGLLLKEVDAGFGHKASANDAHMKVL